MVIVGNWKMNCLKEDAINLINGLDNYRNLLKNCLVVICPPNIIIPYISILFEDKNIVLGAQDCSSESVGSYTGDVSAQMIKNSGCSFVIVGHSERRTMYNESSNLVKAKALQAINNQVIPIICVGETIETREKGNQYNYVENQILESIPKSSEVNDINYYKFIIAYEPIWAIGSGEVASNQDINKMHHFIKNLLNKQNFDKINDIDVIYGGSVKPDNASEILKIKNVDGVLVGGSSLKADEFNKIVKCIN